MKRIKLTRLWTKFIFLVKEYMKVHALNQKQIAGMVGMQRSHFNALLQKSPIRPFTGYYLLKFIRKGIIKVNDIYDESVNVISIKASCDGARVEENFQLLEKIARIRRKGVDFEKFLEIHFPNI